MKKSNSAYKHILRVIQMNAPFAFCQCPIDYSGNGCFWICSRFVSVIRSFLPFNTVEYKSWRAVTTSTWKSAEMSFWPLYGERRIAFSLSSCHIWRHIVITGYDDRFRRIKNRLIFRLHFLQQFKLGTAFFVRGFGCAFFILNRLRVLFVTALRTIRQFRSTLPLSQQSATASRWIFMRTWQTCRRVQGWYGVWTAANMSIYPPPTAWPAAWSPSPRARRR